MPTQFTEVDPKFRQGKYLNFRDDGHISIGSKTRKFAVISRHTSGLLGYVKWFNRWRQYTFFPLNAIFDKYCLREIADFCELVTNEHRTK